MATIGMSASLNQIAILFVQIVLNNSLTYYGQFTKFGSDIPLAACGIVMKTNAILLAIIIGISQGMQPIIGFNYGAQKYERVKRRSSLRSVQIWLFHLLAGLYFNSAQVLYYLYLDQGMRTILNLRQCLCESI